jgi:hypothetical protein
VKEGKIKLASADTNIAYKVAEQTDAVRPEVKNDKNDIDAFAIGRIRQTKK